MAVLVTVGTTSFGELIREVTTERFLKALLRLGYQKMYIQYGPNSIEPTFPEGLIEVVAFRYATSLDCFLSESSLVISHGGAGTCMEALSPPGRRKLIIVINESLMDNHQTELASSLYEGKHAFVSRVEDLYHFISTGEHIPFTSSQTTFGCESNSKILLSSSATPASVGLIPFHRGSAAPLVGFLNGLLRIH